MKIALLGGEGIKDYSIAPLVWESIAKFSEENIDYFVYPISNSKNLKNFIEEFSNDDNFKGFNVALPWKTEISKYFLDAEKIVGFDEINTVSKSSGSIKLSNTDINGLLQALNLRLDDLRNKNILLIGYGGVGKPLSMELAKRGANVVVKEVRRNLENNSKYEIRITTSEVELIRMLRGSKLDVIINCSPIGKKFLTSEDRDFRIPIKFETFVDIIQETTVVMECNYYPYLTPLLEVSNLLNLVTIPGVEMLVNQAILSAEDFLNTSIDIRVTQKIINKISETIKDEQFRI